MSTRTETRVKKVSSERLSKTEKQAERDENQSRAEVLGKAISLKA